MTLPSSSRETELMARVALLEKELAEYRKVGSPDECNQYKHAFYSALGQVDWDTILAWKIKCDERRALRKMSVPLDTERVT